MRGMSAPRSRRPTRAAERRGGGKPVAPPADAESPWVQLRSTTSHPFVYRRMVGAIDPAARPGDVVNIYDKSGSLFGRGLFNPRSEIAVRVLSYGDTPIDDAFWRGALGQAVALRQRLRLDDICDAYRLVHAEGDGLSGLIVERYADSLVVEVFSLGIFNRVGQITDLLREILPPPSSLDRPDSAAGVWQVVVRADERVQSREGFGIVPAAGKDVRSVVVREHGVRYRVNMTSGHKTGFFCDQRDNRLRLARLCHEADVLDCCCYTGGFGLCAAVIGGARSVTCVDLDEDAIALARENANLNQKRVNLVHADVFPYLRQMAVNQRSFDTVVLDPPKLARTRDEYDDALSKYHDLNVLGMRVVRPGGILLTCSCSGLVSPTAFMETVQRAARRVGRMVQIIDQSGAAPDHPVRPNCPESAYLKAIWLRVI